MGLFVTNCWRLHYLPSTISSFSLPAAALEEGVHHGCPGTVLAWVGEGWQGAQMPWQSKDRLVWPEGGWQPHAEPVLAVRVRACRLFCQVGIQAVQ